MHDEATAAATRINGYEQLFGTADPGGAGIDATPSPIADLRNALDALDSENRRAGQLRHEKENHERLLAVALEKQRALRFKLAITALILLFLLAAFLAL